MTRTALVLACCIFAPAPSVARPAPSDGSVRAVALEALAAKADLPAARPALPSLLADRDAGRLGGAKEAPDRSGEESDAAKGQARGAARSEAAKANSAAANGEAAKAAAQAKDDVHGAAEKAREEKTRKKPKPPHPPKGGP